MDFDNPFIYDIDDETLEHLQNGAVAHEEDTEPLFGMFTSAGTTTFTITTSSCTSGEWFVVNGGAITITAGTNLAQDPIEEMRETINNLRVKFFEEKYNTRPPWSFNCHAAMSLNDVALQQLMQ